MEKERTYTLKFVCHNCGKVFEKEIPAGVEVSRDGRYEWDGYQMVECPKCETRDVIKLI